MNVDILSNVKKLEAMLAEREKKEASVSEQSEYGKEVSKMAPSDPNLPEFIERLKIERVRFENKLRFETFQKEILATKKIKQAKKLEQINKRATEYEREKKFKTASDFVGKVNKDLEDVKGLMGRTLEYIDSNEEALIVTPRVQAKMQKVKRMLAAFYYGLNSSVKFNAYDGSK